MCFLGGGEGGGTCVFSLVTEYGIQHTLMYDGLELPPILFVWGVGVGVLGVMCVFSSGGWFRLFVGGAWWF